MLDQDMHIAEFKIRLKPADADLLRALARKLDIPPAVLVRRWVVREVEPVSHRVTHQLDNGRRH